MVFYRLFAAIFSISSFLFVYPETVNIINCMSSQNNSMCMTTNFNVTTEPMTQNQCLNSHPECPSEVCYTDCPCACFIASSSSPCLCSAATCSC